MRISITFALAAACLVSGCAAPPEAREPVAHTSANPDVLRHWAQSCALCHVTGNGGAPRLGRPEDWQPRLASGREALLTHTIEGFNNMPPLGYCMACEREDFVALIELMLAGVDAAPGKPAP